MCIKINVMKNISIIGAFIVGLFFLSCSQEDTPDQVISPVPTAFTVRTVNDQPFSIDLEWSKSTVSDNTPITYDIYLENNVIKQGLSATNYTFDNLKSETSYNGKVVANSKWDTSSEKSFSFTTQEDEAPSSFTIDVEVISKKEAKISWTEAVLSNGGAVAYDLELYDSYYNKTTVINDISKLEYLFNELYHGGEYTLKIAAKSTTEKTTTAEKKFEIYGTPPSNFSLSMEDITPGRVQINWTPPTIEDGSVYYYEVYLDEELKYNYLNGTANLIDYSELEEGKSYTTRIVAKADNNTETEASLTFTTMDYPDPSNFSITSIEQITSTKIYIDWETSTMDNGLSVYYNVYVNGEIYEHVYFSEPSALIENLNPDTVYTIEIRAYEVDGFGETFSPANEYKLYPVHPQLQVTEAILYERGGGHSFEEQLVVKFNQNIDNVNITKFHAGVDTNITSFSFYPTSILSNKLTDSYNSIRIVYPYGYVLVKENNDYYIVDFDVIIQ